MKSGQGVKKLTVFDVWGRFGITEHPGGVKATRRLIELCGVQPGSLVLYIGCGTGYTACLLAREYGARVVALDRDRRILRWAEKRIAGEGVAEKVELVQADAGYLPFKAGSFDAALAESVLIFCDPLQVARDVYRLLKPGGVFGDNELVVSSFSAEQSALLQAQLSRKNLGVDLRLWREEEWKAAFTAAGFQAVTASRRRLSAWEQLVSHLEVDGVLNYLSATVRSLSDPALMASFLSKDFLKAVATLLPNVGYGLFVSRKA